MPLTAEHQKTRRLSEEQLGEVLDRLRAGAMTFDEVIALPSMERAEVLDALNDFSARVRVRANQPAGITFQMGDPNHRRTETYEIPGTGLEGVEEGTKKRAGVRVPSGSLPLRAAVYVATNRDYPLFGGPGLTEGERVEGVQQIVPVPARPDLLSFELQLD